MNRNPNETPPAAEFGLLRAFLARLKMKQSQINEAVGTAPHGRTRAEITAQLLAWLQVNS